MSYYASRTDNKLFLCNNRMNAEANLQAKTYK